MSYFKSQFWGVLTKKNDAVKCVGSSFGIFLHFEVLDLKAFMVENLDVINLILKIKNLFK